jgi:hypothetical protein
MLRNADGEVETEFDEQEQCSTAVAGISMQFAPDFQVHEIHDKARHKDNNADVAKVDVREIGKGSKRE